LVTIVLAAVIIELVIWFCRATDEACPQKERNEDDDNEGGNNEDAIMRRSIDEENNGWTQRPIRHSEN
jgi:hypothetical protein